MIITRTPLRISFAGGGTDIPSFYKKNDYGCVVSTSIDKYVYVTIKKQEPIFKEKIRLNYSQTERIENISKIKNPIIKACLKYLEIDDRLYIGTIADAPSLTGLGSSSTFCVGLLNALYKFIGKKVSNYQLAEEAAHIEINLLKRPIGKQDHYAAAFGGINEIIFKNDNNPQIKKIKIKEYNKLLIEKSLIMFWSGITRQSSTILKSQEKRSKENKNYLIEIRNLAEEIKILLEDTKISINQIGKIIDKGWQTKKKLSNRITNEIIDEAYDKAISQGAYGGKLCGAGGGGFLFFLADKNKKNIIKEMERINYNNFKFKFENKGTRVFNF